MREIGINDNTIKYANAEVNSQPLFLSNLLYIYGVYKNSIFPIVPNFFIFFLYIIFSLSQKLL